MNTVKVVLKENSYDIVIGAGLLKKVGGILKSLKLGEDAVIVTNSLIWKSHGKTISTSLKKSGFNIHPIFVPDSEESKSAEIALSLIKKISRLDVQKKIFVVAFGGGVVGDLAGLVAAIYKRGIPYVQVPTTLLAQIDSAIGGKTAIDLSVGKNLVGAFYQPKLVLSDTAVLKTLALRQIRSGLAEAVKYGVIKDKKLFAFLRQNCFAILALQPFALSEVVRRCSQIKADVVKADEKETKNIRTILNFGHTVGHAIEAASGFKVYAHGEAIALGMRVVARISGDSGLCSEKDERALNELLTLIGLPQKIKKVSLKKILTCMAHDKKFQAGKNRFVLMTSIGRVKVVENIPSEVIRKAIQAYQ